jgi:hypothetical protein
MTACDAPPVSRGEASTRNVQLAGLIDNTTERTRRPTSRAITRFRDQWSASRR